MPLSNELELLAPAKDADIGIEAVNHGADAVYIGGPAFGARAAAGNSVQDIERLARHAHRYNARIFATINTIFADDELEGARQLCWDLHAAGADALIVQDMGLLQLDLPPIQLHASTQTDIRTPEKARFLQDVGFSQMVLARELDLGEIRAIANVVQQAKLEFFIHGALCVAYSGQCFISHAHTGRSANRGDCSQACRLPYTVTDAQGGIVAHDKHVLSMKDNDQSANLEALIDAGIRSFKIEGRYKDMGYVKNLTAHYRQLLDQLLERRSDLQPISSGRCSYTFTPDPQRNFNRGSTDYFVNGRLDDIGAFDSPKHAGLALGQVVSVSEAHLDIQLDEGVSDLHNGDGLTWYDLQQELHGLQVNTAQCVNAAQRLWRVVPNESLEGATDLRRHTLLSRNRDMAWNRLLEKKSAERRIGLSWHWADTPQGFTLSALDADGYTATVEVAHAHEPAKDAARAKASLREQLAKLGNSIFTLEHTELAWAQPWFVPTGVVNSLRRSAIEALEAARATGREPLPRALPVEPPVPYPEDSLSYLANVYNHAARDFYAHHGVKVIDAAYESHEEPGEVSLMITKHCVRWSLSLCPKQAKGVTGVQGTVKAEPLSLINGKEKLTLRFDCKPCEMHVVGKIKPRVLNDLEALPIQFYKARPAAASPSDHAR
jgi:collagenase-like PrtC family protease